MISIVLYRDKHNQPCGRVKLVDFNPSPYLEGSSGVEEQMVHFDIHEIT